MVAAYLDIREPQPASGAGAGSNEQRRPGSTIRRLEFQFNPKEVSLSKSANWERPNQPGAETASYPQFKGAGPASMSLEIFLDAATSPNRDVPGDVDALLDCVNPTSKSRTDQTPHPPLVVFGWGSSISFTAIVKQVSAKYAMFQPDGKPVRATCTLSLEEYPSTAAGQNPTSGGTSTHRTRTVRAGDTLASIAYDEYGDAALWRGLATTNRIEDPMRTPVGTTLLIPPDEETGERS